MKSHHIILFQIQEARTNEGEWTLTWRNDRIEKLLNRLGAGVAANYLHEDLDELHEAIKDAILDAYLVGRGERK